MMTLKVILPVANVAISAILLGIGYTQPLETWSPVPGQLAYSINAPANLLRNLVWFEWDRHIYPHCSAVNSELCIKLERGIETVAFLFAVALVWYVVGMEIEAGRRGTRAMARFGTRARVFVDVVLFSAGLFFGFLFVANWRVMHLSLRSWIDFGIFLYLLYLVWALVFVIPYGRDLIRLAALKGRPQ